MKYEEVKNLICEELKCNPGGLTYSELKANLNLPYKTFCPEWTKQLEVDLGLTRTPKGGRALVWQISKN